MAHPYHHALSSVRKWGGTVEDYLSIHDWFDRSKEIIATFQHRALRHHAEGVYACEAVFGKTLTLSSGRIIPTRWVGEQHVKEDLGFIPSFADWAKAIRPEPWMGRTQRIERELDPVPASLQPQPDPSYAFLGVTPEVEDDASRACRGAPEVCGQRTHCLPCSGMRPVMAEYDIRIGFWLRASDGFTVEAATDEEATEKAKAAAIIAMEAVSHPWHIDFDERREGIIAFIDQVTADERRAVAEDVEFDIDRIHRAPGA